MTDRVVSWIIGGLETGVSIRHLIGGPRGSEKENWRIECQERKGEECTVFFSTSGFLTVHLRRTMALKHGIFSHRDECYLREPRYVGR